MPDKEALKTMRAFTAQLDEDGTSYRVDAEMQVVRLSYKGENFDGQSFTFVFDDNGTSCQLYAFSIEAFEEDQLADAYEFCNNLNAKYRWLKFYIDTEHELTAKVDAIVSPETVGRICKELLFRAVDLVDDICKLLQE